MTITRVTEERLPQAAAVYREAWRESHRDLCTPEFLERRDCGAYLEQQMAAGKAAVSADWRGAGGGDLHGRS